MLNTMSANEMGSSLGTISLQSLMENQFVLLSFFSQYNINLKTPTFNAFHFLRVFPNFIGQFRAFSQNTTALFVPKLSRWLLENICPFFHKCSK